MATCDKIKGRFQHYGVLIVPIELNGINLDFMVDSGASFCGISSKVAKKWD